jgi:hypothetical protein
MYIVMNLQKKYSSRDTIPLNVPGVPAEDVSLSPPLSSIALSAQLILLFAGPLLYVRLRFAIYMTPPPPPPLSSNLGQLINFSQLRNLRIFGGRGSKEHSFLFKWTASYCKVHVKQAVNDS